MPRGRSAKFLEVKRLLVQRIGSAYYPSGVRFMSNSAVAREFRISRPTAQSLLNELALEGYLDRRSSSGTFIPGSAQHYTRAHLVFHPHAKIEGYFETGMLQHLKRRLNEENVPWKLTWSDQWKGSQKNDYCVLCERTTDRIARELAVTRGHGLILDSIPPSGVAGRYFDSISIDDFHAGVLAGRVLRETPHCRNVAILANPRGRHPWVERTVLGFRTVWPRARIVHPLSWSVEAAAEVLDKLFSHPHEGVLCSFQRQAVDVQDYCARHKLKPPALVVVAKPPRPPNFPVPSINVSLHEFVEAAVRIIHNRISGDPSPTLHIALAPRLHLPA